MVVDVRVRCEWPGTDPLNLEHHDLEWGVPSRDRRHLFELLTLEGAQAGLSWTTILRKRDGYREAFKGFEPERVAGFGPDDVDRLLLDPGIVRNRGKIESTIDNARAILALEAGGIDFVGHLWSFVGARRSRTGSSGWASCLPRPRSRRRCRRTSSSAASASSARPSATP
jgi:DNA-3-methyladenine glycosylase I